MSSLKFAVIGLGFIAPRHFAAIEHIGGEVILTVDINKDRSVGDIPRYTDYQFLTAHPRWGEVDAVVILSPNDTHMDMAAWAVRVGKKVISEKPLAIQSSVLSRFVGVRDIYTVMQLRYHPVMEELKKLDVEECELYVKVMRGPDYWAGWKGDEKQSGGILFNIGIHYFDALFQLFGNNCHTIEIEEKSKSRVKGSLQFYGLGCPVKFHIEVADTDEGQDRYILANGVKYRFSSQANLSAEDLHKKVYEDFVKEVGVRPIDLLDLTRFIERLKLNV